ncbi:sulfotransferase 6B1-like isoform X2 [Hyla sarda]|uniref:sulfotransferase 6B1-like isoform X2 n=1 Tax=Hyla sarda TaxID=327740 RepID=UPI0024C3E5D3|nr:sulfotransferase 6B1-like isoform X2 [Hyla sarda]
MEKNLTFLEDMKKAFDAFKNTPKDELLFTYNGVMYPTAICDTETFQTIETFEAREEDLMMVAYPKCGTNWTMLLLNGILDAAYKKEPAKVIPMIEFKAPNKFEMLVSFRNPKDTAVSLFNFYKNNPVLPTYNSWDDFFPDFMAGKVIWGSYFDHAVVWNKHIDKDTVLLKTFEDMKEDLKGSVEKICKFFGISITEEQVKQIAEKGTFKSMKENSEKTHGSLGQVVFRKGDVGDWKNYFSEAQSQEVDAKFEECLGGTKLGELLKYNVHCTW